MFSGIKESKIHFDSFTSMIPALVGFSGARYQRRIEPGFLGFASQHPHLK